MIKKKINHPLIIKGKGVVVGQNYFKHNEVGPLHMQRFHI